MKYNQTNKLKIRYLYDIKQFPKIVLGRKKEGEILYHKFSVAMYSFLKS
jgi:hypothetical protein